MAEQQSGRKKKGGNTVSRVWEIAQPIAEELGLSIWDIRFQKEGAEWYLRVFIDKEGGVGIDDCVDMSRALDAPLEEADPIPQGYCLEVSSPGIERDLVRDEHFEAMLHQDIMIKLIRPLDGVREIKGELAAYENGEITVETADGSQTINKKETSWVRLNDYGGEN